MPNCNICKYAGRPTYKSPCSECKEFSKYEYEKKKTNADRIRAMSDEEQAEIKTHKNPTNCQDCAVSHGWRCRPARDDYKKKKK